MKTIYEFNQNNSGGSFKVNDKLCHRVFIEANNAEEANEKAEELGIYFNGCDENMDCPCCGDRWYSVSEGSGIDLIRISRSYKEEFETIENYVQYLANIYGGWTTPDARIYYLDNTVKEIFKEK